MRTLPAKGLFGIWVRKMRLAKGWSQPKLAQLSGVAHNAIHRVEQGGRCRWATVVAICKALGFDPAAEFLPG
jgi:transcriptional regulator with XRE-family HTH domain